MSMLTSTLNRIPKSKAKYLVWEEFENILQQFIMEYIETREDLDLKKSLLNDNEFISLNRKLEMKLWNMAL